MTVNIFHFLNVAILTVVFNSTITISHLLEINYKFILYHMNMHP